MGTHLAPGMAILAVVPQPGLLFGFMLAAAVLGGYAARWARVPRVVGYLVSGVVLNLAVHGLVRHEGAENTSDLWDQAALTLRPIKDLALGMILFSIGGVFETQHLKSVAGRLLTISLAEVTLTPILVGGGCAAVLALTPRSQSGFEVLALALLLGCAAIETAPAATLLVLREYDAKGPMTDTILSLIGVNNVVCIALFYVAFGVLAGRGVIASEVAHDRAIWLVLAMTLGGSLVLGVLLGVAISVLHSKVPATEMLLIVLALLIVLGNGEKWLMRYQGMSYNFLLTILVTGAVFANVALDPQRLESSLGSIGTPIFAAFFVMAGYDLHLEHLVHIGWLGLAYVGFRLSGKCLGCFLGTHWSTARDRVQPYVGLGMLCQASLAIALADYVGHQWHHPFAAQFKTVVLGAVVIFELVGALLIKWTVVRSGEVKAITLIRRRTPAVAEGASITRLTVHALLRTLGLTAKPAGSPAGKLQVKHVMRTNVRALRASASLDEVLKFVEHSRYNHFPVIDDEDALVGVIHFSDLREMIYDPTLRDLVTAVDMVDPDARVVAMDMPLEELLEVFREEGTLGALPVVPQAGGRRLVGIVEQRDLLRALHLTRNETGSQTPGE